MTGPTSAPGPHPDAAPLASSSVDLGPWRPALALHRAFVLGALGALAAVALRRADVLVLATPMLVVAAWGWWARPRHTARAWARVDNRRIAEGTSTTCTLEVSLPSGGEQTLAHLPDGPFVEVHDGAQARRASHDGVLATHSWRVRPTRWGTPTVGPALVVVRSPWWAYRTTASPVELGSMTVTPQGSGFDSDAPTPHPEGLVGVNRSSRSSTGAEFATIRPFVVGDRLRRIHWPASLRSGELHVTTTYADQDAHVALVVDAFSDLGPREGIDGRPTSLDLTVRASASLADHYLGIGDRVSLRVLGARGIPRLAPRAGSVQARRVLDTLARVEPASDRDPVLGHLTEGLTSGSLVVVLTPLVHPAMAGAAAALAARGLTTVVVDTMPEHLWADADDVYLALAWRLRRLDRDEQIHRLGTLGVPVVPWRGPGSLDEVLRGAARRSRRPKLARR